VDDRRPEDRRRPLTSEASDGERVMLELALHLNSFRVSISVVLPGLRCFLPYRGGTEGGRSPTGGPTPVRRRKFHAAAAKGRRVK
jgi:hypothetical protein